MKKSLKKLLGVDPRTVWRGEATEFTPWLAEPDNIALLEEAMGLDLQYHAQEQPVGPKSVVVYSKDPLRFHVGHLGFGRRNPRHASKL